MTWFLFALQANRHRRGAMRGQEGHQATENHHARWLCGPAPRRARDEGGQYGPLASISHPIKINGEHFAAWHCFTELGQNPPGF
jgi:hypothetical protein